MAIREQTVDPRKGRYLLLGWAIVAAIAGLCCVVLPPFFIPTAIKNPDYGWPLIPWFATAFANRHVWFTMALFFAVGLTVGFAQPQSWILLWLSAISLSPIVNAINIVHDWTIDATSHNLFPFEFVIIAFFSLPALPGTFLGSKIRHVWTARRAAQSLGAKD